MAGAGREEGLCQTAALRSSTPAHAVRVTHTTNSAEWAQRFRVESRSWQQEYVRSPISFPWSTSEWSSDDRRSVCGSFGCGRAEMDVHASRWIEPDGGIEHLRLRASIPDGSGTIAR